MDLKNFTSQGLSIRTPMDISYQINAINSLEKELKIMTKDMDGEGR